LVGLLPLSAHGLGQDERLNAGGQVLFGVGHTKFQGQNVLARDGVTICIGFPPGTTQIVIASSRARWRRTLHCCVFCACDTSCQNSVRSR
jgi:hypothetical protein